MRRPTWKKPEAKAALSAIAQDIAEFFAVPAPAVTLPEHRTGRDWAYQTPTLEVWTKAGRAELNLSISATFGHMYFRFAEPARAESVFEMSRHDQRLNRHSGKWNAICTPDSWARHGVPSPQDSLEMFRAELRADFRKVAEPNPPADEVAAYREKEAESAARWAEYVATLHA